MIAVGLLEQHDVLDHVFFGDIMAGVDVAFVPVGALELDRHAVDQKHAALDLDFAKTDAMRQAVRARRCPLRQTQNRRIKVGRFRRPLGGIGNRHRAR